VQIRTPNACLRRCKLYLSQLNNLEQGLLNPRYDLVTRTIINKLIMISNENIIFFISILDNYFAFNFYHYK